MKYTTRSAALVYLLRTHNGCKQVLLQLRGDTYGSGTWDASSAGHVDEGESMIMCARREALEEIGVSFAAENILFSSLIHYNGNIPYYNLHLFVEKFDGIPRICEKEKATQLKWFYIDELPENMFADRGAAIQNFINKRSYSEMGWG